MLYDVPYSDLKEPKRGYAIMLSREHDEKSYTALAKVYGVNASRIREQYLWMKNRQLRLYANHIAITLGHADNKAIYKECNEAHTCYVDIEYVCAYLEKKHKRCLDEYRDGEPGMPSKIIDSVPPLRVEFDKKTIASVIEMRDYKKASFITIGNVLSMTQAKASKLYDHYYHKKTLTLSMMLEEITPISSYHSEVFHDYIRKYPNPQKRYDAILLEHPHLLGFQ